jgi:pimeloyl-ACP methyl ester carboxylesterase
MSTFALVHGAWHGAWCWERLVPELQGRGHRVIAMDLPCDDSSATFDDYADVVCAALSDDPGDDLILVGHSLAGQTIPLVAAQRPVRRLVYLCAVPAVSGQSLTEQLTDPDMLNPDYVQALSPLDPQSRRTWIDKELARSILFGACDEATATWAFERLRPQSTAHYVLPCSLPARPTIDSTYVVCTGDGFVNPDWSTRIARDWLDARVVEIPADHSPFLSRPAELAKLLVGLG